MNYAAWLQARLDDPTTPRAQYVAYWNEMQDLQREQNRINYMARAKQAESQLRAVLHADARTHIGRIAAGR